MPRPKPVPLPDRTAFNLRQRAHQMRLIAFTVNGGAARTILEEKAAGLLKQAEAYEQKERSRVARETPERN